MRLIHMEPLPRYLATPGYAVPPRPPRRNFLIAGLVVSACAAGLVVMVVIFWTTFGLVFYSGPYGNLAYATKMAVSQSTSGRLIIYELACPDEWVQQVDLTRWNPNTETWVTLWDIRSSTQTTVSQYTVGGSPPGFRTVKHLTAVVKPGDELEADMVVSWGRTFSTNFYLRNVKSGSLYIDSGPNYLEPKSHSATYGSPAKFRSARDLVCKNQKYELFSGYVS